MTHSAGFSPSDEVRRPAILFYPGDHMRDMGLASCSLAAQGFWMRTQCVLHDCRPYGVLCIGGKEVLPRVLARLVGATTEETTMLLHELGEAGVYSRTPEGLIYSRRMVRDEALRLKRAAGGVESLKNPKVPRPKGRSIKDAPKGTSADDASTPPSGASFAGSPSLAGSVASSDSFLTAAGSSLLSPGTGSSPLELDDAAAAGRGERFTTTVPDNVRCRLEGIGISPETGMELAMAAGGWENLFFALERLSEKQVKGEVHNASGLLVKKVRDLAEEGRGAAAARIRALETEVPEAFRDSRWINLPAICKGNAVVGAAWACWWKLFQRTKSNPLNQDVETFGEERKAWRSLLDQVLERHPEQASIRTRIEEAIKGIRRGPGQDSTYFRAYYHHLSKELGLLEPPQKGVAS